MALASLVAISGPKKSRFSEPTPSNGPCNKFARTVPSYYIVEITKCRYLKSITVDIPRRNWDSPTPSLASECAPPPRTKGGGAHSLAGEGLGEPQFRRLEKSLALCLFCGRVNVAPSLLVFNLSVYHVHRTCLPILILAMAKGDVGQGGRKSYDRIKCGTLPFIFLYPFTLHLRGKRFNILAPDFFISLLGIKALWCVTLC
jgi:hypothetical protein